MIQSWARLSLSDRDDLNCLDVMNLNYISKNTYLCQCQHLHLSIEIICELKSIVYVSIYWTEFKIALSLKAVKQNQAYEVNTVFHKSVSLNFPNLKIDLVKKLHCLVKDIKFLLNKTQLTIQDLYLNNVMFIDNVHYIEDVSEVKKYNNVAQQILNINIQSLTKPIQQQAY